MRAPESEKKKEIPAPTQEGSVKDYCGIFSLYAVASGKSVEDIKEKFIQGLSVITCIQGGSHIMRLRSTCEKQDIKHVGVCGSSANFPAKMIEKTKIWPILLSTAL
ncbi:unnamed protein product [Rhizophagus irregularis]|nr:unnamed protein product [Rhizophagus irregularis]CAB5358626.1 unnamed protein product [Rhizophagus irregularis]